MSPLCVKRWWIAGSILPSSNSAAAPQCRECSNNCVTKVFRNICASESLVGMSVCAVLYLHAVGWAALLLRTPATHLPSACVTACELSLFLRHERAAQLVKSRRRLHRVTASLLQPQSWPWRLPIGCSNFSAKAGECRWADSRLILACFVRVQVGAPVLVDLLGQSENMCAGLPLNMTTLSFTRDLTIESLWRTMHRPCGLFWPNASACGL